MEYLDLLLAIEEYANEKDLDKNEVTINELIEKLAEEEI